MPVIDLPRIQIDAAQMPRLIAAVRERIGNSAGLTDTQALKRFIRATLRDVVQSYEERVAFESARASIAPPPDFT